MDGHVCQGFTFYSNFDSANLHRVEFVPKNNENDSAHTSITGKAEINDFEFNLWTKPDCFGTEFENGNRTWFYFAVKTPVPFAYVKFNIVDMNKQAKLYGQGMAPVFRIIPGKFNWERISEKATYSLEKAFTLTFKFRMPENTKSVIYFAFTYPFSFQDLQNRLEVLDKRTWKTSRNDGLDEIYYVREIATKTVQGRRVDLLTITSYHDMTDEREMRLNHLFPDKSTLRPFKFRDKKIIFLSARVHPGETPSSFVLNGFINFIMTRDDHTAQILRRMYVFKIMPCLNPDGVVNGHYRTDTRGVNLNRVYLRPSVSEHPAIYAARSLVCYYHFGDDREPDIVDSQEDLLDEVGAITLDERKKGQVWCNKCRGMNPNAETPRPPTLPPIYCVHCGDCVKPAESGLFLYLDMHGHASKKGIFMYGNHFDNLESNVRCMLLPKLMSLNNHNFHFTACNFTEKNMYLKDKRDGMSREGSGRVAVFKMTGLIQSYTLECNYNTGRIVNVLPSCVKDSGRCPSPVLVPPKYTPAVFEEVGRALGSAILDLTNSNPFTRLAHSEYRTLAGLREWLRFHCTYNLTKAPKKSSLPQTASLHAQAKSVHPVLKTRPFPTKYHTKKPAYKQRQQKANKRQTDKETLSPEPCCSHNNSTPLPSSSSSSGGGAAHPQVETPGGNQRRLKKPLEKRTNYIRKNIRISSSFSKPKAVDSALRHVTKDVKVKEICIKRSNEKRAIATYERNNKADAESLVVAWEPKATHSKVFKNDARLPSFGTRRNEVALRQRSYRHVFIKQAKSGLFIKSKLSKRNLRGTRGNGDANLRKTNSKAKPQETKKKKLPKDALAN